MKNATYIISSWHLHAGRCRTWTLIILQFRGVASPPTSAGTIWASGNARDACVSLGFLGVTKVFHVFLILFLQTPKLKWSNSSEFRSTKIIDQLMTILNFCSWLDDSGSFGWTLRIHQLQALFIWVLAAAALALLIYVPYAEYVTSFLNEAITRDFEVMKFWKLLELYEFVML